MRKCPACGYLLFGDGESCTHCGAELQVVTAGAPPAAVAPPAAAAPPASPTPPAPTAPGSPAFTLPPPPVWAAPAPPAPSVPPLSESWQPATIVTAPPAPPRSTRLGIAALAAAIAVAAVLGVIHFHSDPLPAGTSAFVAGNGITYTAPDGAFQVQLPQAPLVQTTTLTLDSQPATAYVALVSGHDYEAIALSVQLPSVITSDRVDAALESMVNSNIDGVQGKLINKSAITRDNLPAMEAHLKAPDGYREELLVVASGATLIVLGVHAKTGTSRLFKALEDSLNVR